MQNIIIFTINTTCNFRKHVHVMVDFLSPWRRVNRTCFALGGQVAPRSAPASPPRGSHGNCDSVATCHLVGNWWHLRGRQETGGGWWKLLAKYTRKYVRKNTADFMSLDMCVSLLLCRCYHIHCIWTVIHLVIYNLYFILIEYETVSHRIL